MSTPTPSSASKKATGHVSTPSHMGHASPAPRSVPSPVTTRKDHAGKTPINHPTTGSSQGTKTVGSTPMVQQLSRDGFSNSSPSGNFLGGFGTPAGLGVDLGTPGQLNMPTPAGMSAPAMNISMSELGLSAGGNAKRNEDEERRAKMRRVLHNIGRPKGRVSEEGIARVARRVGFASDIDGETLSREERERKVGNRMFSIAGNTVQIDISMEKQVPRRVDVAFSIENETMKEQGEQAGRVLFNDLTVPLQGRGVAGNLDSYTANLGALAKLDKISSDGINCFEAIAGVYAALLRLYEQQKHVIKAAQGGNMSDQRIEHEVLRRRSGKPTANAHGKLGLAIQYWQCLSAKASKLPSKDAMEIDGEHSADPATETECFSIRVEVESSPSSIYPPLRVTNSWLPSPLDLTPDINGIIPWQDPPPTYLKSADRQSESLAIDGSNQQRLPDLRFICRLDPAVVMPWQTAANILSSVGNPQPPLVPAPYHHLLLSPDATYSNPLNSTSPNLTSEHSVLTFEDGKEKVLTHKYRLFTPRLDYTYKLEDMPFSHPRQIIEALPTLRQWALIGILIRSAFSIGLKTNLQLNITEAVLGPSSTSDKDNSNEQPFSLADFDALPETNQTGGTSRTIDVNLVTSPIPSLAVNFLSKDSRLAKVEVQILANAELVVPSQNLVESDENQSKAKEMAKALEVCTDLGIWVEWLRKRYNI